MNKKLKLATLGILSSVLLSSSFDVKAEAPPLPIKPTIEGEKDDDKIIEYNQQVENYNHECDIYNQWVDDTYDAEVEMVKIKNKEIEAHNQEEKNKKATIDAINLQKQAEYDNLYAQYLQDKEIESKILGLGIYSSVEEYNEVMNNANQEGDKAEEKNSNSTLIFDINNSYEIQKEENEVSSGDAVEEIEIPVHIEHYFTDIDTRYTTDFTIGINDTITFYCAAAQLEPTSTENCCFYTYTNENYLRGYWVESDSYLATTAIDNTQGWKNGDTHTISFKNGTDYPNDTKDITMIYTYSWTPLKKYKTYNVPKEPTLELEIYNPNILDLLPDPVKKPYAEYLEYEDPIDPDWEAQKDKKKNKNKKKKNSDKKEENIQKEEKKEENNVTTQVKNPKPAPAANQPIVTSKSHTLIGHDEARNANTGDYSVLNFRIAILIICAIVLFVTFYPWKKKDDQVEFNDKLEDIDIDDDDIDLS